MTFIIKKLNKQKHLINLNDNNDQFITISIEICVKKYNKYESNYESNAPIFLTLNIHLRL